MLGSVVIPAKAIVLNVLSLSAAFGLLVWVFQDGHWVSTFGLTSNGSIDATQPILIFAIAFGLAMDYELFLLSRIKEEYDRTRDNTRAIAVGIQRTAGIITSAALMLVVVIGLFATGKISIIQQVGVGLGAAVAIDATIVRMVLVPSAMRLLGRYNWWAPKPLAWVASHLGLRET
jgi:RND superfamily putative drug exporter